MFGLEIFFLTAVLAATPPTLMRIPDFAAINLALSSVPCLVPKPLESSYTLIQATFGGNIVASSPSVNLPIVLAHPDVQGCAPLDILCPEGCVVLTLRGKCSFFEKAQFLRSNITNATVLVVYNDVPGALTQMLGQNERPTVLPDVPAFFLGFDGGDAIASALRENVSVHVEFDATGPLAPSEFTALRSVAATMMVLPCDGKPPGSCVDCSIAACSWSDARPWTDLLNLSDTHDPCLHRIAGTQCRHGHIVSLLFPFPLNGSLPLAIGDLPFLERIAFVPGSISEVGCVFQNLTKLKVVELAANGLREFPGCSYTPYLEELYLTDNYISEISPLISSASSLRRLDIDDNYIEFVPPEIGTLPNLMSLNVDFNSLTELDPAIGSLGLTSLSARVNGLTSVPTEILGMTSLLSLRLDGNSITSIAFPVPLTNLSTLTLSNNNLSAIPALLTQMPSIEVIHLGENKITGPVPHFHNFGSIVTLNLNDNAFTGALPSLNTSGALQQLWLHNNNFAGPLPDSWKALVSLKELRLQRNKITTPIHVMRSMTQLTFVDLSYNNISLPSHLEFSSPTDAGALIFATVPSSILYINMAYNNIAGTIDGTWFGVLRSLQTVNVSHNRIESAIDVHELPSLQVLDFSHNALTVVDELMPESPDLRLIAYNGNPDLKLKTSYLPFWLTEEQPEVLYPSLALLCLTINPVPGVARSNFQILLDPAFSHSQFCECIPGTYGKPPSCLYIPDYYEVNGSITDQLFGERRQVAGVDIVFGPPVTPSASQIRTLWIELAIGPEFAEFTDMLEVFVGDKTLKGERLLTVRGTDQITADFLRQAVSASVRDFSLVQLPSRNVSGHSWTVLMLELYVPYAVIHFQSRKESGAHFNATFSHSFNCPTDMVPSASVATCVHSSQVFAVSSATQGILYFLVTLGALCIVVTMAVFTKYKLSRVVRASSYLFSMLTLTSLLVFLFGSLLYAAPPMEVYECHLRVWFTFLPLVCLLSFFLTKINRVRTIFTATKLKTDVRHLKSLRMLRLCFYMAGTMTLWLIVLSALPVVTLERHQQHTTSSTGSYDLVLTECVSTGEPLFSVWCTVTALFICLILMWGIYNAWRIRNTPSAFNESSLILASLLGVLILATLCALFLLLLPLDPNLVIVVWGLGQVILALFLFGTLFGPKLWALTRKEATIAGNGSGSTNNLGSPSMMRLPNSFSSDTTSEMAGPPRSELEMVTERLDAAEKALKFQRQLYEKIFREWGWTGELP